MTDKKLLRKIEGKNYDRRPPYSRKGKPLPEMWNTVTDLEHTQLIKFQEYLEKEWPSWPQFEGGLMYSAMWRAFVAGWNSNE